MREQDTHTITRIERDTLLGVRLALSLALPLSVLCPTHSQQPQPAPPPPLRNSILQLQQTPRYATNLALPTQADDTFLGQDKPGPYILTWKNFQTGVGNPVQVFIDGKLLSSGAYTLDVVKGELTFQTAMKRTQLVRVRYGYYVGIAQKNPNPAPAAPLTVSLAALGLANLSMTAVQGQDSGNAKFVWNLNSKASLLGGGFSSQFNFATDGAGGGNTPSSPNSTADRLGAKLGYAAGDVRNGVDVSFLRGGKQFASTVGKNFGFNNAAQSLGVAGHMNPAQWLAFNVGQTEIRDLNGKGSTEAQNFGFRLGDSKIGPQLNVARSNEESLNSIGKRQGEAFKENIGFNLNTKGAPNLGFTKTADTKTDIRGYKSGSETEQSNLTGKINGLGFSAKTNKSFIATADKKETRVNQEFYNLAYSEKNQPSFLVSRSNDFTITPAGVKTGSEVEKSEFLSNISGVALSAKTNKSLTATPDKKQTRVDQEAYTLGYAPKNQPSLQISRNNDFTINPAGAKVGTGADKAELATKFKAGAFGVADLVARTQTLLVATPDRKQVETETQTLGFNYTGAKPTIGSLNLTRTDEARTDASGVTKTVSDTVGIKKQLGPLSFDAKSTSADIVTPDKKNIDLEQQTYSIGYTNGKSVPRFGFFRSEDERKPESKTWFGSIVNRYDISHRVGTADFTYQLQETDQTTPDQKQAQADLSTFNLKLINGPKRPTLTFSRTEDDKTDTASQRTAVVTNKTEVTSKLGAAAATVSATQAQTNTPDPKTTGLAQETALSLAAPGSKPGTGASITVLSGQKETGAAIEQKQGLGVKLQPSSKLSLTAEQKDQTVTPIQANGATGTSKTITSLATGAELAPMPGTKLTGVWQSTDDGVNRSGVTQYGATLGLEKSAFQFTGNLKDRYAVGGATLNPATNIDTANAKLAVRPFTGFQVTGAYTLNPEDPAKPGQITQLTRREYGVAANLGGIQLGGTYAMNQYAPTAVETVKAGAPQFGEYNLTLGLRFNRYTNLNGTYKNTFFYGAGPKGLQIYTFGLTHNVGSAMNFTMGGTMTSNLAVATGPQRYDYKAEAKLGVKF